MRFSKLLEEDRNRSIEEGKPIVLNCELSHDPSAHVDWYKDGIKLTSGDNMEIKSDGLSRTLLIPSAQSIHAGIYECSTSDDSIAFKVDIKGEYFLFVFGNGKDFSLCAVLLASNYSENELAGKCVLSSV